MKGVALFSVVELLLVIMLCFSGMLIGLATLLFVGSFFGDTVIGFLGLRDFGILADKCVSRCIGLRYWNGHIEICIGGQKM